MGGETRAEEGVFASLQGLHWLVVNLAARKPLLLLADDVHWADTASLRWLVFLAERVEDVEALLVVATRPAEPGADQELLDALMVAPAVHVLRPAPLSAGATTTVVRERLPKAVDAFSAACYRATGGNAFLLGELLGELADDGIEGTANEADKVLEFGSERVGRAIRRQAAPAASRGNLGRPRGRGPRPRQPARRGCRGRRNGRRGGRPGQPTRWSALTCWRPRARSTSFIRWCAAPCTSRSRRLSVRRCTSRPRSCSRARGAESERIARHLLPLPPSADLARVAVLRAAARGASARGDAGAAAHYLRRALEEPPGEEERGAVLYELGVAEATDRQRDCFDGHLREAMAETRDPGSARADRARPGPRAGVVRRLPGLGRGAR